MSHQLEKVHAMIMIFIWQLKSFIVRRGMPHLFILYDMHGADYVVVMGFLGNLIY